MPNQTTMQQNTGGKSRSRAGGMPAGSMPEQKGTEAEKTSDRTYAIVSVLYHALQGVEACEKYVNDARQAGDAELEQFFASFRTDQQARAEQAKSLLLDRLEDEQDDEDETADDEDERSSDDDEDGDEG